MIFRAAYENVGPKEDIPIQEFMDHLPPEVTLELSVLSFVVYEHVLTLTHRLLAADYLDGKGQPLPIQAIINPYPSRLV